MHMGDGIDPFCCIEYSAAVFFNHFRLNSLAVSQSMDGCALRNRRGAVYQIFIDILNRSDDLIRSDNIADPPASHGKVFGERI